MPYLTFIIDGVVRRLKIITKVKKRYCEDIIFYICISNIPIVVVVGGVGAAVD